jgi:hydrogenase large subunit
MDPVTRVAGAIAINIAANLEDGTYLDARSQATLFRGYEVILMGRDPRDAIFISSRACGVCGGVHSHASAYAIEMAMGLEVPPMGTIVRNLGETAEMGYDNPLHLYLLAGPDYSEIVVKATNPEIWEKAKTWLCPGQEHHGFRTMADLMSALNPLTGSLYREGLDFTRLAREMFVLLHGKFPHPQAIVPGGVSSTISLRTLNEYQAKLGRIFDYAQRLVAVWDDIPEFFYECDERYKLVGSRPVSMIDLGFWDDPNAYDSSYANCNEWGGKRWSTPGAIIDGELGHDAADRPEHGHRGVRRALLLRAVGGRPLRHRPPRQPALALPRLEQADAPKPSGQELEGEVHVGVRPALGPKGRRGRRLRPALQHRDGAADARERVHRGDRAEPEMRVPKGFTKAGRRRVEAPGDLERVRAQPGARLPLPVLPARRDGQPASSAYSLVRSGDTKVAALNPQGAREGDPEGRARGVGLLGRRPRLPQPPPGRWTTASSRTTRSTRRRRSTPHLGIRGVRPALTRRRCRIRRSSRGSQIPRSSPRSTCSAPSDPSIRACRARRTPRRAAARWSAR